VSFLLPQLLWALPAASIPLIIHLLSRANTRVVNFSTLIFLQQLEHKSIRRLHTLQWLVILLRTLIILVLLLLLARPVVKGYFQGWLGVEASTLSVVLVDDSFSLSGFSSDRTTMSAGSSTGRAIGQLDLLLQQLADQASRGDVIILRVSDGRVIYDGPGADLPGANEIVNLVRPGYHQDNLSTVLDTLASESFRARSQLYANRELTVISDFQIHQQGALRFMGADTTLWKDWHFFLLPVPRQTYNAAVTRAAVITAIPLAGKLMEVAVTVLNTGDEALRNMPVQIVLNDVRSGQLVVDLNPGERKAVTFQVAPTDPGHQFGYAVVERDQRLGDNRFYFHTYIPEKVRIVLIQPPTLRASFVRMALETLEATTPQVDLSIVDPAEQTWTPGGADVLILNGLEGAPRLLTRRVDDFLGLGGTLLILPGTGTAAEQALGSLQEHLNLPPADLIPLSLGASLSLDPAALAASILARPFDRELELGELPEISQLYPLHPRGQDEVILRVTGGRPLLVRTPVSEGSVFLFALPCNLQWTDLPLKGSFIPLWHYLTYWRSTGTTLADVRTGETPVIRMTPRQSIRSLTIVAPDHVTSIVVPDMRTRSLTLRNLQEPGIYTTFIAGSGAQPHTSVLEDGGKFAVNIPDQELTAGTLNRTALQSLFAPDRVFILDEDEAINEWIQEARFGHELWRPLLYLLILLIVAEMIIGNVYSTPRRHS